tara:strand:+ start:5790 stop:6227 length:438 start_codon:yes stop_codon:yes gene_type:complete
MTILYISIGLVALCWGGYPLILRLAGGTGHLGSLILVLASLIPVVLSVWYQSATGALQIGFSNMSASTLVILTISGIVMGAGLVTFNYVVGSPLVDISTSVPIIDILMLVVTVVGGILFFMEVLTLQKVLGILLGIVAIYLLRPV